jgi:hypothetical protein
VAALALVTETQCLIGEDLVDGEAVVQFDHVDVSDGDARAVEDLTGGSAGHRGADHVDHRSGVECGRSVGDHALREDLDSLSMVPDESLADQNSRGRPV